MSTSPVPHSAPRLATASEELAVIYAQNFRTLLAYARSRQVEDPEDVVHESILKAAEKVNLAELEIPASYLTLVTKRTIIGRARRQAVRQRYLSVHAERNESPGADEQTESKDQARQLNAAMAKLPVRQRAVITMHVEGLTPAEIARFLSSIGEPVTANEVSCTINRGRRKLRRLLLEDGFVRGLVPGLGGFRRVGNRFLSWLTPFSEEAVPLLQAVLGAALVFQMIGHVNVSNQPTASSIASSTRQVGGGLPDLIPGPSIARHESRAAASPRPFRSDAETTAIRTDLAGISYTDDRKPPPSLPDQLQDLANHPERLQPGCSGLPICRP